MLLQKVQLTQKSLRNINKDWADIVLAVVENKSELSTVMALLIINQS